ncbi:glycosyltransferase [Planobispora rosea]|uniref:glycosyltransferase n=1 Tax=Planobispora rosea TaxID=35762 RepID=UPI001670158B|nr:glycosyltransferase family 2 protein [Planobispora rosea]
MRALLKAAPGAVGFHIGFEGYPDLLTRLSGGAAGGWTDLDRAPTDRPPAGTGVRRVLLLARTPADLRRAVPLAGLLPRAREIAVIIGESPAWRPPPVPAAGFTQHWNKLLDLRIRRHADGSWRADASFVSRIPAGEVLKALSRGLTGLPRGALNAPVVSLAGVGSCQWRPGDPNVVLAPASGPVPSRRDAPGCDVALRTVGAGAPSWPVGDASRIDRAEPVTGSVMGPVTASVPPGLSGDIPFSVSDIPPIDEFSVCPIGFLPTDDGSVGGLRDDRGVHEIVRQGEVVTRIPLTGALTEVDVARLRELAGVAVDLGRDWITPVGVARIVCGLAAAGVPVLARPDTRWSGALGAELAALLDGFDPEDLSDALAREQYSIRLRRAALTAHGTSARWRQIAQERGIRPPDPPSVSVLLCTRRPELVASALGQVARQRGVETEVILTLHGCSADLPEVSAATAAYRGAITVLEEDAGRVFGEVLNRAARRASGTHLAKMDDDDWYGPDHLSDLVLAQRYSGADLVGAAGEFYYLEPLGITVRRCIDSELYTGHVAGSSILISRAAFDGVGGFRPISRTVDGQLLEAVTAGGGRIYRTHGFNYLVGRRHVTGHTWQEPLNTFLTKYRRQWRGFRPNALMEMEGHPPHGVPGAADGEAIASKGRQ